MEWFQVAPAVEVTRVSDQTPATCEFLDQFSVGAAVLKKLNLFLQVSIFLLIKAAIGSLPGTWHNLLSAKLLSVHLQCHKHPSAANKPALHIHKLIC